MMDINTIHWFPNHIADMRDFQEIAKAYDYLLMQAMDNMQKVFKNQFLNTLDEDGCAMHEQILGIGANPVDTLEDRRRRIRGYYASDLPYTENKLRQVLSAMCEKNGFEMIVDEKKYQVDIQIRLNSVNMVNNVREIARKMIPANMVVNVNIIYNIHQRFQIFTHADLSKYTHEQLRSDKIFQAQYNFHGSIGRMRHSELAAFTHQQIFQDPNIGGKIV